jgi:hypothetical protein
MDARYLTVMGNSESEMVCVKNETRPSGSARLGNAPYDFYILQDRSPNSPNGLTEKGQYILNNPVRKTMVASWEEYRFCGMIDELPL